MKLPEYFNVKYDALTLKSYLQFDYERYRTYSINGIMREIDDGILQNEMRTGVYTLYKIFRLVSSDPILYLERDQDYRFSVGEYRHYVRDHFNVKIFAQDDVECFWNPISRYYPFTEEEILEYMKYLNVKELEKNMFISISEETMDLIKCYEELNN